MQLGQGEVVRRTHALKLLDGLLLRKTAFDEPSDFVDNDLPPTEKHVVPRTLSSYGSVLCFDFDVVFDAFSSFFLF